MYVSVHIFTFSCSLCFCGKHEPKHGILCDLSCVGNMWSMMLIMVLLAFHYYLFISLETASDPPNESFDSSQLIVLVFIVLNGVKLYLYLVRVRSLSTMQTLWQCSLPVELYTERAEGGARSTLPPPVERAARWASAVLVVIKNTAPRSGTSVL